MRVFLSDIDGTLPDTERICVKTWQTAAAQLGYCPSDSLMRRAREIDPMISARMMEKEVGGGFPPRASAGDLRPGEGKAG